MRISEEQLNIAKNNKDGIFELWSTNSKELYDFKLNSGLAITKFFGKSRDFSITDVINNWKDLSLTELNSKITKILKSMNEQSKEGGCHGCDYPLKEKI